MTVRRCVAFVLVLTATIMGIAAVAALVSARREARPRRLLLVDGDAFRVPAYVIGLKRHWELRGARTMRRLRRAGHVDLRPHYGTDGWADPGADGEFRRLNLFKRPGIMHTRGERGCSASHLRVYERMVRDDVPRAVVYEDDALPCDDYADYLPTLLDLARPFDLVLIGHMHPDPGRRSDALVVPGNSYAYHAYTITLAGARTVLDDARRHGWWEPIDMTAGKFADRRMRLRRGLANHRAASRPRTFEGRRRANGRSYGFVAQDGALGTSIKEKRIVTWHG